MMPENAQNLAIRIWGDLDPDKIWKGANQETTGLHPDDFNDEVLDVIAKDFYGYDEEIQQKAIANVGETSITMKAHTSSTASVLIPTFIDPRLIDLVNRDTPFLATVPNKGMRGKTVNIPRRNAGITPEFLTDAAGSITANDHTFGDINVTVKYLYAGGEVTYPAIATTQETRDLKKTVIEKTFMDLQRYKEQIMLRGRISAGTEGWSGGYTTVANGYDGLFKRVHEDYSSNETELAGTGAINIGDIDDGLETLYTLGGRGDYIVMDFNTAKVMMQTARTYKRYSDYETKLGTDIGRGMIDNIPFFATAQLPATVNNRSLAIVDKRAIEMRTLVPDRFRQVGQNLKDSTEFYWSVYETFVVAAPEWVITYNGGA